MNPLIRIPIIPMLNAASTHVADPVPDCQSLLERAREGDADAFSELCREHEARLLRQAWAVCGDLHAAEELAQDTLVEAWKCLHRYNGRCQFFTWLCAILLNRHRNRSRSKKFRFLELFAWGGICLAQDISEPASPEYTWPDGMAQQSEQSALVRRCVQALPEKQRQVVYLRFFAGESLEGIAGALNCSLGTVKSRLFHALEKLRAMKDLNAPNEALETKQEQV